ncbi:MAG: hypothetical protein QXJ40_05600 [Candidatus Bathyarchaeia archaeon]
MDMSIKRIYVALVLTFVLTFSLVQGSTCAAESVAQKKTLSLLTDVIMLDLAKYNMTLLYDQVSYPAEYGGIAEEEVRYKLEANGSKLDATAVYRNNALAYCLIDALERSRPPFYTQAQPANLIDKVKGFLDRYQKWAGSPRYQELKDILDMVSKVESTTVTLGNVKLTMLVEGSFASFQWAYSYDGFEQPGMDVSLRDGDIWSFGDIYGIFKVGSTTIKVSREEAISIAREQAKNFSWKVGLDADATEVKDFTILETPVKAELSMQAREPLTLYPFWRITLYLDKAYPGGVIGIVVGVWADTGEVRYIEALSYGGAAPPEATPTSTTPTSPATDMRLIAAATLAVIAAATITTVLLKKKRSK